MGPDSLRATAFRLLYKGGATRIQRHTQPRTRAIPHARLPTIPSTPPTASGARTPTSSRMPSHPLMQSHSAFSSTPHITPHILHREYAQRHDADQHNNRRS